MIVYIIRMISRSIRSGHSDCVGVIELYWYNMIRIDMLTTKGHTCNPLIYKSNDKTFFVTRLIVLLNIY